MDADYKGHHIIATAWHNPNGWKPRLHIVWGDSKITVRPLIFKKRYAIEKKAQQVALSYAKKWIDNGKPPLP